MKLARLFFIFFIITQSCKQTNKDVKVVVKSKPRIEKKSQKLKEIDIKSSTDSIVFDLEKYIVYFVKSKKKCWSTIKVQNKISNRINRLDTKVNMCFEKNSIEDFSPNQKYLLLHSIEKGILEIDGNKEEVEKYYCIFFDIENMKLSEKNTDLFCSGEWNDLNEWIISEDEKYKAEELFGNGTD